MVPITFPELPGWNFSVDERSAGVYVVAGRHLDGRSLRLVGYDPELLLEQARADADNLNHSLADHDLENHGECS